MTSQKNPWDLDQRIRERNLKKGILSPKEMERYLKELPDVGEQADIVTLPQPVFEETSGADHED